QTNTKVSLRLQDLTAEISKIKYYPNAVNIELPKIEKTSSDISEATNVRPSIRVVNGDCLEEAACLLNEGLNPLVLIMASKTNPGGGYMNGAGAQEENLCRRTNLIHVSNCRSVNLGNLF